MDIIYNFSTLYDNIQEHFNRLIKRIVQTNKRNRNHLSTDAENLFCIILNTAFGWELINANRKKVNQDTFDLESPSLKWCVQVTANQNYQTKLNRTLKRFETSNKGFEKVIILFITSELPSSILKEGNTPTIPFQVYDIDTLYKDIQTAGLSYKKLNRINKQLDAFIRPVGLKAKNRKKEVAGTAES